MVQGGLEILCKVSVKWLPVENIKMLVSQYKQLIETSYVEPDQRMERYLVPGKMMTPLVTPMENSNKSWRCHKDEMSEWEESNSGYPEVYFM